jgi:hypothetical protein
MANATPSEAAVLVAAHADAASLVSDSVVAATNGPHGVRYQLIGAVALKA